MQNFARKYDGGCSYPSLAMVYSPKEEFVKLLSPEDALSSGTLFEELLKPLLPCPNYMPKGDRRICSR